MKQSILCIALALLTGSLMAAPKDDVQAAIKKLSDGGNYSWATKTENAGGGGAGGGRGGRGFGGGPASGKVSKDGYAIITRTFGENSFETVVKGEKSVSKNQEGAWQTPEELAAAFGGGAGGGRGGRGGRGGAAANRLPTLEAQELLSAVGELKAADGAFVGDLSKEAAGARLSPFGRGGRGGDAAAPAPTGKGTVKFWVKDGALAKYELNVQGETPGFQGGDPIQVNRTTTVEFKDIGTTKVEVPEDAKKKLM